MSESTQIRDAREPNDTANATDTAKDTDTERATGAAENVGTASIAIPDAPAPPAPPVAPPASSASPASVGSTRTADTPGTGGFSAGTVETTVPPTPPALTTPAGAAGAASAATAPPTPMPPTPTSLMPPAPVPASHPVADSPAPPVLPLPPTPPSSPIAPTAPTAPVSPTAPTAPTAPGAPAIGGASQTPGSRLSQTWATDAPPPAAPRVEHMPSPLTQDQIADLAREARNMGEAVAVNVPREVVAPPLFGGTLTPNSVPADAPTAAAHDDALREAEGVADTQTDTHPTTAPDAIAPALTPPAPPPMPPMSPMPSMSPMPPMPPMPALAPASTPTRAPEAAPKPAPLPAPAPAKVRYDVPLMTPDDQYLFNEGTHLRLYDKLGAHLRTVNGVAGTHFAVWAPNARVVSVVGEFNGWVGTEHNLAPTGMSGIWEGFIPGLGPGTIYKYHISSNYAGYEVDKADPYATFAEVAPKTASVIWDPAYEWHDAAWMRQREERNGLAAAMSIYEVHLGSWKRVPEEGNRSLTYREIAPQLAEYLNDTGFTHVEFLPVMEHPFFGSWGYQVTGYFAPTSRYGTPQDFAYLVDYLHQHNIGVILDWVPAHFPTDQFGLDYFDGTHLYEHADPRQGFHPDWKSDVFNYGRNEVRSFLLSSAASWLDRYHVDGLRVDGVASMLYLDYSREAGEWVPNRFGGRENLDAVGLLTQFNTQLYGAFPGIQTIAEESTSWPMVSRPTYIGGLGFGAKWDMGWMHDTLEYLALDPVHRTYHHNALTFRMIYAFFENFVLPLSHDEVVYGKGSLLNKMSGDDWQKFANLRLLFGYQWAQSGKKLVFMGGEFGQWSEWNHDASLDWDALNFAPHRGVRKWVQDLNRTYQGIPALHERDFDPAGFEWIDANDANQSVATFLRYGNDRQDPIVVAVNFTPVPRHNYRIGVPFGGFWNEILNSDATEYGGSGQGNMGGLEAAPLPSHGRAHALTVTVPPLGIVFFRRAYGT